MTFWSQSLFTYDPHGHFSPGQDHPHWNSQLDKQYYRPCTLSTPSKASDFYNPDYGLLTPPASNPTTSAMATPDADEMEQFQRLSDQYQANLPVSSASPACEHPSETPIGSFDRGQETSLRPSN